MDSVKDFLQCAMLCTNIRKITFLRKSSEPKQFAYDCNPLDPGYQREKTIRKGFSQLHSGYQREKTIRKGFSQLHSKANDLTMMTTNIACAVISHISNKSKQSFIVDCGSLYFLKTIGNQSYTVML